MYYWMIILCQKSQTSISRLILSDKEYTHDLIVGDKSYMDPVYLQTSLLIEKVMSTVLESWS